MEDTQNILCGRTYSEHFQAIKDTTSTKLSKKSVPFVTIPFQSLVLTKSSEENQQINLFGTKQVKSWEIISQSAGEQSMLNTGELPSDVKESTLSQILIPNVAEKYCLSKAACLGICRRAMKRGKKLPPMLWDALMEILDDE